MKRCQPGRAVARIHIDDQQLGGPAGGDADVGLGVCVPPLLDATAIDGRIQVTVASALPRNQGQLSAWCNREHGPALARVVQREVDHRCHSCTRVLRPAEPS